MFKVGDIVYWNGKEFSGDEQYDYESGLTINKPYIINTSLALPKSLRKLTIVIKNDLNLNFYYHSDRFMSLKDYRKRKIVKILC